MAQNLIYSINDFDYLHGIEFVSEELNRLLFVCLTLTYFNSRILDSVILLYLYFYLKSYMMLLFYNFIFTCNRNSSH